MSSDEFPHRTRHRVKLKKAPSWLPSKKPRARRHPAVENPERVHRELKNYLLTRRLVVERSLNPEVRKEADKIDLYLSYIRSLEK